MPEAYQEFQKAVDVTPYMARQLIEELKQMNAVAPGTPTGHLPRTGPPHTEHSFASVPQSTGEPCVKPYLVFDGDNLPSKAGTEQDRYRRRQESKSLGLDLQTTY
jgi:5'-3' exonuclease